MTGQNATVVIFPACTEAEAGIGELRHSGFDLRNLSVISQETHAEDEAVGYYAADGRLRSWGRRQAFWSGVWDGLAGGGMFCLPGVGALLVAGPLTNWIIIALENAPIFGGLTAPGAALYSIGLPKAEVLSCELALKEGKCLVVAHGPAPEVERARQILDACLPAKPPR